MKKNNLWRIIWIVGIYAVLVAILYLVIMYKVKWEDKDFNKYLYFYDCSNQLCTSEIAPDKYYSKIICEDKICPFIKEINNNYLVLSNNSKSWIYDYENDKIINNYFTSYEHLNNNYYKAIDSNNMYGIIDIDGNVLVNFEYEYIDDFKNNILTYKKDNKYKFLNTLNMNQNTELYDKIVLINDKLYGYLKDEIYYIATYENYTPVNNIEYKYLYAYEDIIFAVHNKKIEILDSNLHNTLLMNISTFYEYTEKKEKDSLNIHVSNEILYFDIIQEDKKYIRYAYDLKNKKIL